MQVIFQPSANQEIAGILEYYLEVAGPTVARRIHESILAKIHLLLENPLIGLARPDLGAGLRMTLAAKPAQKYRIYFRPTHDQIQIVRIVHGFRSEDLVFAK